MILAALKNYFDRTAGGNDGPPLLGFAELGIVGAVDLDLDGRFMGVEALRIEQRGHTRKLLRQRLVVPQPPKRSSGINAGFLCDRASYLLGFDMNESPKRAAKQFAASRSLHETLLKGLNDPMATTILAFFATWTADKAAKWLKDADDQLFTGWLVFRDPSDADRFAHDQPALRMAWVRHSASKSYAERGQCLVTGEHNVPLPWIHPAINGVLGAQSTGASLVSFNRASFTSFGRVQNLNAPIGVESVFAYSTALNHLLRPESRLKLHVGDTTLIVWSEADTRAEHALVSLLRQVADSNQSVDKAIDRALSRIAVGDWISHPAFKKKRGMRFFVLGLAPNVGRLRIRFFVCDSLEAILLRLQSHFEDLLLGESKKRTPAFYQLASELLPKNKRGKERRTESDQKTLQKLLGDLMRAVLTGYDYPQTLLPYVLDLLRMDGHFTLARIGLVKACLNRHRRFTDEWEVKMALNETIDEPGYLLGRLFAVLENIEELSRGPIRKGEKRKKRPTIRDRFAASASITPNAVFPHLLQMEQIQEKKALRANPQLVINRLRDLRSLMDHLNGDSGFNRLLNLRQQGLFFIGYFQQQRAFFQKGEAPEEIADDADTIGEASNEELIP